MLAGVTRRRRCASCGRSAIADPEVRVTEQGVAHFAKVILCGAVWLCPVCAPWIRQQRAEEIDGACTLWLAGGGAVLFETLTLPHNWGQPLAGTLGVVRDAFRALNSGRARLEDRDRFGLAYFIRAHDCTHGANGWHPHLHNLPFLRRPLSADALAELGRRRFARWAAGVEARRLGSPLPEGYSLEAARSRRDVSRYICQVVAGDERSWGVAMELARGDLKLSRRAGHRTPMDILADFARSGDAADLALWHEWEEATAGVHAIQFSRGLRAELGLGPERTDEELVAVEVGGELAYIFTDRLLWRLVCDTRGGRYAIKRAAELGYYLDGIEAARAAVKCAVAQAMLKFHAQIS